MTLVTYLNIDLLMRKRTPNQTKRQNFPFSTEKEILNQLKGEAQDKDLSPNALINKVLTRYVTYYKYIERKGKVVVPNKSFQFILNNIDEDILFESIKKNELDFHALFVFRRIPITFENFVKYALDGSGLMGGLLYHYTFYKDEQGYDNMLLEHNYDIKWSRIIGRAFSELLREMFDCNTVCTNHDHRVIIKILEKHVID